MNQPVIMSVLAAVNVVMAIWFSISMVILSTNKRYLVFYETGQIIFAVAGLVGETIVIAVMVMMTLQVSKTPELWMIPVLFSFVFSVICGNSGWNYGKTDPSRRQA